MPWIHFDMQAPDRGTLTDDDSAEIGIITGMQIEYRAEGFGGVEGQCSIEILITDMDRFPIAMGLDK